MTIDFQAALDSKTRLEEKLQQTRVMNLWMNKAGQCNAVVSWSEVRPSGRQVVIFLQEALPHPAAIAWGDASHAAEGDLWLGGITTECICCDGCVLRRDLCRWTWEKAKWCPAGALLSQIRFAPPSNRASVSGSHIFSRRYKGAKHHLIFFCALPFSASLAQSHSLVCSSGFVPQEFSCRLHVLPGSMQAHQNSPPQLRPKFGLPGKQLTWEAATYPLLMLDCWTRVKTYFWRPSACIPSCTSPASKQATAGPSTQASPTGISRCFKTTSATRPSSQLLCGPWS